MRSRDVMLTWVLALVLLSGLGATAGADETSAGGEPLSVTEELLLILLNYVYARRRGIGDTHVGQMRLQLDF